MNLSAYQREAHRTAIQQTDPRFDVATVALGLAGEAGEIFELFLRGDPHPDLLTKEVGDLLWYIAEGATITGRDLADLDLDRRLDAEILAAPTAEVAGHLLVEACKITDYLKKVVIHGHNLDVDRFQAGLGSLLASARLLLERAGLSLDEACERNIAKLKSRYPAGFDLERSMNRDT